MKIFKRVIIVIAVTLVCAGIAVFAGMYFLGGFVIDTALNTMSSSDNAPLSPPSDAGKETIDTSSATDNPIVIASPPSDSPSASDVSKDNATVPPSEGISESVAKPVYSSEKIASIKASVTLNDKIVASKLLFSKLTGDEINYLLGLLAGGLTNEEFLEAKQFALSKFSQEDIQMIYNLYKKYTK